MIKLFAKECFDVEAFTKKVAETPLQVVKAITMSGPHTTEPSAEMLAAGVQKQEYYTIACCYAGAETGRKVHGGGGVTNKAIFNIPKNLDLIEDIRIKMAEAEKCASPADKARVFGQFFMEAKIFQFPSFRGYIPKFKNEDGTFRTARDIRAGVDAVTTNHSFFILEREAPSGVLQARVRSIDTWQEANEPDANLGVGGVSVDTEADVLKELENLAAVAPTTTPTVTK